MNKVKRAAAAILIGSIIILSAKISATAANPGQSTPSGISYTELEKALYDYIEERQETTSSVAVTVFGKDDTLASEIYGYSDAENQIKADEETVYEWGSISKMLVWTSVMQLWEQGRIDLNRDIREYLPEGFLDKITYENPVTMIHLMNHTAGWQETTWDVEVLDMKDLVDLGTALQDTSPPQIYEPGTVCSYSNWGAALAAYIVENISGMDYVEYIHKNIFEVLGMEQTFLAPDGSDNLWAAEQRKKTHCYLNIQGSYESYGECRRYIQLYPVGSASGTMNDLVKFAKAFLCDSTKCPLFSKGDTLNTMLTPTLYYNGTDIARSCHGLLTLEYGTSLVGHSGNTAGCSSNLSLDVKNGTGVVVMTNEVGETSYNYGILSLIFGDYKSNRDFLKEDLKGIYCSARSNFQVGFYKVYGTIGGLLPLFLGKNGTYSVLGQAEVKQISDQGCIMDDGNGTKMYLAIGRDKDHQIVSLQGMGTDYYKANLILFSGKVLLLFLFVISAIYGLAALIIHTLRIRKFKKSDRYTRKKFQICSELLTVGIAGLTFSLLVFSDSYVRENIVWKCLLIGFCTVLEIICLFAMRLSKKKVTVKGIQKVSFVFSDLCGIVMIINVLFWQFYRFWGC